MKDSKTPVKSALVAVFVNVFLNLTLIWFLGRGGLAAATAICAYLQVVILILALRKRLGHSILEGFFNTLLKTIIATVLMSLAGIIIITLMKNLPESRLFNILRLLLIVPSAAVIYALCAKLLRNEMLSLFTGKKAS
jgi:putative peptidoglycan lipid II flippase